MEDHQCEELPSFQELCQQHTLTPARLMLEIGSSIDSADLFQLLQTGYGEGYVIEKALSQRLCR